MGKNDFGSNKDKSFDKSGTQKTGQTTYQGGQKTPQQTNLGGGARQERPANTSINQQANKPKQPWTQTGSMSDKDKNKGK